MKIELQNHGSIFLAFPVNDEAAQWLFQTAPEDAHFFGRSLVIEPRYVEGFVMTFEANGGELV